MGNDTGMVEVQLRDDSGNWRTYAYSQNIPAVYRESARQLKWQFPDTSVRVVDSNGRVIDFF